MSVGSKLAVLVWGIWALCLSLIIPIGAYLYHNTELELTFLITLFSGILVGSLVPTSVIWRTLRDSLSKKLEHLHETLVFPRLYRRITGDQPFTRITMDEVEKTREDLSAYGKFLGIISLYPGKALEKTDEFISSLKDLCKNLEEIGNLTGIEEKDITRMENFLYRCGFRPLIYSASTPEAEQKREVMAQIFGAEHTELMNDTKEKWAKLREIGKQIRNELEDFFRRNNLPFEYV